MDKIKAPLELDSMAGIVKSCSSAKDIKEMLSNDFKELVSDDKMSVWSYKMTMIDGGKGFNAESDDACAICYAAKMNKIFFAVAKALFTPMMEAAKEEGFSDFVNEGPYQRSSIKVPGLTVNIDVRNMDSDVPMISIEYIEKEFSMDDFKKMYIKSPDDRLIKPACPTSLNDPITFDELFALSVNMPDINQLATIQMPWPNVHKRIDDIGDNHVEEFAFAKGMKLVEIFDNTWELEDENGFYFYYGQHCKIWNYHFGFSKKNFEKMLQIAKSQGFDNEQRECKIGTEDGREMEDLFITKVIDGIQYNMHYIDKLNGVVDIRFEFLDTAYM